MFLRPFDAFHDDALGVLFVAPAVELRPFPGLEVFVMREEMLDLLEHNRRHVLVGHDIGILRKCLIDRHAQ